MRLRAGAETKQESGHDPVTAAPPQRRRSGIAKAAAVPDFLGTRTILDQTEQPSVDKHARAGKADQPGLPQARPRAGRSRLAGARPSLRTRQTRVGPRSRVRFSVRINTRYPAADRPGTELQISK